MMETLYEVGEGEFGYINKESCFSSFVEAVEDNHTMFMAGNFQWLKHNGFLEYKEEDFLDIWEKAGVEYENNFTKFVEALTAFQQLSKTEKFKAELINRLKSALEDYQKNKNTPASGFQYYAGCLEVSNEKAKEIMVGRILRPIYLSMEFLKGEIPKELLEKAKELDIYL